MTAPAARIDRIVTRGTFVLDGAEVELENNVWLVGDDAEVLVVDPANDADAVAEAVGGRRVTAVVFTHGHRDHIGAALEFAGLVDAPQYLSAADGMLWEAAHPGGAAPPHPLTDGARFEVAGVGLTAIQTPGHTPGSTCLLVEELGVLLSGDTLFRGGPGATGGRPYSDFDTIIDSIRERLLVLDSATAVYTGHGEATTIGAEAPHLDEWIARGF